MTVEYEITNGECFPKRVHTIVISVQHVKDEALTLQTQREALKMHVIKVSYYYVQGGGGKFVHTRIISTFHKFILFCGMFEHEN